LIAISLTVLLLCFHLTACLASLSIKRNLNIYNALLPQCTFLECGFAALNFAAINAVSMEKLYCRIFAATTKYARKREYMGPLANCKIPHIIRFVALPAIKSKSGERTSHFFLGAESAKMPSSKQIAADQFFAFSRQVSKKISLGEKWFARESVRTGNKAENINSHTAVIYFQRSVISAAGDFPWDAVSPYNARHRASTRAP
jgi:hypothetical protein